MGKITGSAQVAAAADVNRNVLDTNGVTVTAGWLFGVMNNASKKWAIDPAGAEVLTAATVAGAGSDNTDATAITAPFTYVTGADDTVGVKLPTAVAGKVMAVYNTVATNGLKIYPATDASINGGTATTGSITIEGKTLALFVAITATNWGCIFTANT